MMPYVSSLFTLALTAALYGFCTKEGRGVTFGDRFGNACIYGAVTFFGLVFVVAVVLGVGQE